MISHLLDTSICIEMIRGKRQAVLGRLRSMPVGSVAISTITLAELWYGVARSSDPARNAIGVAEVCAAWAMLPFDRDAAEVYGRLRAGLDQAGRGIGPLDTLIAAHALSLNAILVTCNEREFSRVEGLRVENWARI